MNPVLIIVHIHSIFKYHISIPYSLSYYLFKDILNLCTYFIYSFTYSFHILIHILIHVYSFIYSFTYTHSYTHSCTHFIYSFMYTLSCAHFIYSFTYTHSHTHSCAHFIFIFMFQFVFIFHITFMFHEHIYTCCICCSYLHHFLPCILINFNQAISTPGTTIQFSGKMWASNAIK